MFFQKFSLPKTQTLQWSAVTLVKDTFRPSNMDFLKPQGINFPTMYNTNSPLFDTYVGQIPWTKSSGYGTRNLDGERILEMGSALDLVLCNTCPCLRKSDKRLITNRSGGGATQIDYLRVNAR